jgi:hypothetical protein
VDTSLRTDVAFITADEKREEVIRTVAGTTVFLDFIRGTKLDLGQDRRAFFESEKNDTQWRSSILLENVARFSLYPQAHF